MAKEDERAGAAGVAHQDPATMNELHYIVWHKMVIVMHQTKTDAGGDHCEST